jgi:hypothetical protein
MALPLLYPSQNQLDYKPIARTERQKSWRKPLLMIFAMVRHYDQGDGLSQYLDSGPKVESHISSILQVSWCYCPIDWHSTHVKALLVLIRLARSVRIPKAGRVIFCHCLPTWPLDVSTTRPSRFLEMITLHRTSRIRVTPDSLTFRKNQGRNMCS